MRPLSLLPASRSMRQPYRDGQPTEEKTWVTRIVTYSFQFPSRLRDEHDAILSPLSWHPPYFDQSSPTNPLPPLIHVTPFPPKSFVFNGMIRQTEHFSPFLNSPWCTPTPSYDEGSTGKSDFCRFPSKKQERLEIYWFSDQLGLPQIASRLVSSTWCRLWWNMIRFNIIIWRYLF